MAVATRPPTSPQSVAVTVSATMTAMHDREDRGGDRLGLEDEARGGVLGLGQHDGEEDEDRDRADVDDDLGGGHERRPEHHVEAGQGPEGDDHAPARSG